MQSDAGCSHRESTLTLADLDYSLPAELIAQYPLPQRDASRLLVVERATGTLRDSCIGDLPEMLRPGDLLVVNDTKVVPAKLTVLRRTGTKVAGLFVREEQPGTWEVMLQGSKRLKVGERLTAWTADARESITLTLTERRGRGFWRVGLEPAAPAEQVLESIGTTPLPPYIHRNGRSGDSDVADRGRYQTVYARRPGAIAAPTAGLHLTQALFERLHACGVETAYVTLHVGVGTFKPIDVSDPSRHEMHAEWFDVPSATAEAVDRCREGGGRVIAVGSTSLRALESSALRSCGQDRLTAGSATTDLFIYPPYHFRVTDGLLTNFHLPRTTLLALVMAFAGVDLIRHAYQHAVDRRYRFYSYGDAMLIV